MRVAAEDYKRCTLVALFFLSFSIYSGREQLQCKCIVLPDKRMASASLGCGLALQAGNPGHAPSRPTVPRKHLHHSPLRSPADKTPSNLLGFKSDQPALSWFAAKACTLCHRRFCVFQCPCKLANILEMSKILCPSEEFF